MMPESPLCSFFVSFLVLLLLGLLSYIHSTYALVVDNLDNGSEPSSVGTGREEDDTADLDVPPLAGGNRCGHFGCCGRFVVLKEMYCQDFDRQ